MTANCRRCHGFGSTLAPASRRIVNFLRFGRTAAIAGRSTPGSTPITNMEIAIAAPVFPAEMRAAALPSFTSPAATLSDESRLCRSACDGLSPIPTTWEAWWTSSPRLCAPRRVVSRSMAGRSPTRMTEAPNSRTAATAPATTTAGPWSPPMASTATFRLGPFDGDDLPTLVVAAVRADSVRQLDLAALRTERARRRGELVVRAALAPARLRVASFRQRHGGVSLARASRRQVSEYGQPRVRRAIPASAGHHVPGPAADGAQAQTVLDRKSTRLNSSHSPISYAVFCLKQTTVLYNDRLHGYSPFPSTYDKSEIMQERLLHLSMLSQIPT